MFKLISGFEIYYRVNVEEKHREEICASEGLIKFSLVCVLVRQPKPGLSGGPKLNPSHFVKRPMHSSGTVMGRIFIV